MGLASHVSKTKRKLKTMLLSTKDQQELPNLIAQQKSKPYKKAERKIAITSG
jgi:hypothetical protein